MDKNKEHPTALKSNMDRFIAPQNYIPYIPKYTLKSNMDRFIDEIIEGIVNGSIL